MELTRHPNEPMLVFRGQSGNALPTDDFFRLEAVAYDLTNAHVEAFRQQVARQVRALPARGAA